MRSFVSRLTGCAALLMLALGCSDGDRREWLEAENDAGNNTGGTGGAAGSGGGSSNDGGQTATGCDAPTTISDLCTLTTGAAESLLLYQGVDGAGECTTSVVEPRTGTWFAYGDSTAGATREADAELGGRSGDTDCAFHTSGQGFDDWGAGCGFDLNYQNNQSCPHDATQYTGLRFYSKGTVVGARTTGWASGPNTIHVKLVTTRERGGDDFGGFCEIQADEWTLCEIPFETASREGWNADIPPDCDSFELAELLKVQFELSKWSDSPEPVSYDIWIDDVTFY